VPLPSKFREGVDPDFGRVRPVHVTDVLHIERRTEVRESTLTMMTRLAWNAKSLSVPKVADYVSLHEVDGKRLYVVDRLSRSCVCCPQRSLLFLHVTPVEGVAPQNRLCECATKKHWHQSMAWADAPESGLCKRVGSDSLLRISEAIKDKGRRK
jgi:hypothetical protein